MSGLWIIGNLDCETAWAQEAGRRAGRTVRPLPEHVMGRIALYATLLRVFAGDGDTVWTPRPVDPRCVRPVEGLPDVTWADDDVPADALEGALAWGRAFPLVLTDEELDVMLTVADKCWWWKAGRSLSSQLPGSRILESIEQLEEARPESWVAKSPYSAAGRGRVRGSGSQLRMEARRGVERLIETQGRVLLEPWTARTRDFGCWRAGTDPHDADGGWHDLEVDGSGRFQGIRVPPRPSMPGDDVGAHLFDIQYAATRAGELIAAEGYEGPFGFDAFHYTDDAGNDRVHAPCEINPRLTFGRVAHEYRRRLAEDDRIRLRFGHAPEPEDDDRTVPLLGSATAPIMYAWLEREPL